MNPGWRQTFTSPDLLFVTGLGSGLSPKAPGTAGTLAALVLWIPLSMTAWWVYASIVALCVAAGIYVSGKVARKLALKDPGIIVIDEIVGLWIGLFLLPNGWYWPLIGFLLFRFFDILKPWPISWCDRELEGGYGIVLDDVVAGLFTFGLIQIAALVLERL